VLITTQQRIEKATDGRRFDDVISLHLTEFGDKTPKGAETSRTPGPKGSGPASTPGPKGQHGVQTPCDGGGPRPAPGPNPFGLYTGRRSRAWQAQRCQGTSQVLRGTWGHL
jgi:hypothetical protein